MSLSPCAIALSLVCSGSLILAPTEVRAATSAFVVTAPDNKEEVRALYEEGRARYETLDYDGAIELWTKAYAMVPPTEDNREIRNNLAYNLAAAQEKAFELDGDVTRLKRARGLLQRYVDEFKEIYKPTEEARKELDQTKAKIAELDAKIAAAGGTTPTGTGTATAPSGPAKPDPRAAERDKKIAYKQALKEDPEIAPTYGKGKGMMIGGGVMIGVGAVGAVVGVSIAGLADNPDLSGTTPTADEIRRGRIIGYSVMGVSLGVLGGGVALMVIGSKKRRTAMDAAKKKVGLAVLPAVGPGGGGLTLTGRF